MPSRYRSPVRAVVLVRVVAVVMALQVLPVRAACRLPAVAVTVMRLTVRAAALLPAIVVMLARS
jgi:hypothetical protein